MRNTINITLTLLTLAFSAFAAEFTVTPKVDFDAGYVTRANHLGLQIQKNSAFASSSVSLQNSFATPKVSATHYFAAETQSQTVLDASLSKTFFGQNITAGVQKRVIEGNIQDNFTAYAGLRLENLPIVSKIATPYVSVNRDFTLDLIGTTVGLDRTFTFKNFALTPRAEAYVYDKHTSYTAGGTLAYVGMKYLKPYIDLSYVTSDTALANRKFEGNLALVTGVKLSF